MKSSSRMFVLREMSVTDLVNAEKTPGITPPLEQLTVPASEKHPKLKGTPGESPAMGATNPKVLIYAWIDFQCPNCMRTVEPLKYMARKFPRDVQIVMKNYPGIAHKQVNHLCFVVDVQATEAAIASLAAGRQGKYWEYLEILFQSSKNLHLTDLKLFAHEIELDMQKFEADMNDPALKEQIKYEAEMAEKLGIKGTPGFMIGSKKHIGWGSYTNMELSVKKALNSVDPGKCQYEGYSC